MELLDWAARAVVKFVIDFAFSRRFGTDRAEDADWTASAALARRQITVFRAAGIDGGLADLNDAVLNWIDAQILRDDGPEFVSLVRARVDALLDAGRRGRSCWERSR